VHGGLELLKLVGRRSELLELLVEAPHGQGELEAALEESRSTVDRALRELEEAGLVRWVDGSYHATLAGRLQLQHYREFVGRSSDLLAAMSFLEALPPGTPIGPPLVRGCSVAEPRDRGPEELTPRLERILAAGDRAVLAVSADMSPGSLRKLVRRANDRGVTMETFLAPGLVDRLETEFPELLAGLAADGGTVLEAPTLTFGLLVVPGAHEVAVGADAADGRNLGMLHNDTDAALAWATDLVEDLRDRATDVTADVRRAARLADDRERLAAEGFVDLDDVERADDASLPTGWRSGLDLAAVGGGLAVDRERPGEDGRRSVADEVVDRLAAGTDCAVLGPDGTGKSTVCKTVAWRWHDAGRGPVLYRESGTGEAFESWSLLVEVLRETDGHALVVVEDAVRAAANDVFRVMAEFTDADDVTVLLDAREAEWQDPPSFPTDERLERYRVAAVDAVTMPPLDAREVERFVERFEAATGRTVAVPPEQLLASIRTANEGAADPAALQVLLHRLSLRAVPVVGDEHRTPETLLEDVRRAVTAVQPEGEVGVATAGLANLLNAAGVVPRRAYLHAAALAHGGDHDGVDRTVGHLEGRVLLDGDRTVHPAWSALFLETLRSELGAGVAEERVGAAATALLSLADDGQRRAAVADAVGGERPATERAEAAPVAWTVEVVDGLFDAAREYPTLAPLVDAVELPAALPETRRAEMAVLRGETCLAGGYLDRAEAAFERAREGVDDWAPGRAAALDGRALTGLGSVALRRGDRATARERFEASLAAAETRGDHGQVATNHARLGDVARARGDAESAERSYRAALAAREAADEGTEAARVHRRLATLSADRAAVDAAADHYRAARSTCRDLGDREGAADCSHGLGALAERRGDLAAAAEQYRGALEAYRTLDDRTGQAEALADLALVAAKRGDVETLDARASRALERHRAVGDREGEARALSALGEAARRRGDPATAVERLETARDISETVGDRHGCATVERRRARAERDRGATAAARQAAERARDLTADTGRPREHAAVNRVLADLARRGGDHGRAETLFADARAACHDAAAPWGEALALAGIAATAAESGEGERATDAVRRAVATLEAAGVDDPGVALVDGCERHGLAGPLAASLRGTLAEEGRPVAHRLDALADRLAD
jgi:tetratricopeptide (TPR) repeat protein